MAAPETDFESGAAFSLRRVKYRYDSIGTKIINGAICVFEHKL